MTVVSFTWAKSDPDANGKVLVRERLEGTELVNVYGPLHPALVDSFIRARRDAVARFMSRQDALRVFEPRPQLDLIAQAQRKPRYDPDS